MRKRWFAAMRIVSIAAWVSALNPDQRSVGALLYLARDRRKEKAGRAAFAVDFEYSP